MSSPQDKIMKLRPWMRFSAARHPKTMAFLSSNGGAPPHGILADLVEDGLRFQELLARPVLVLESETHAAGATVNRTALSKAPATSDLPVLESAAEINAFLARPAE